MAVSFLTGRIVYISEQAGVLLRCKRDVFRGARFSELLAPQDVGVFYGSTAPSRLPTWGTGASAGEVPMCLCGGMSSPRMLYHDGFFLAQVRGRKCAHCFSHLSQVQALRILPRRSLFSAVSGRWGKQK